MLTTVGKTHIKRYLGGMVPEIASHMAFGIGNQAAAVGQTKLQLETARVEIALTSYDFVNDKLVFKADLPDEYAGSIYEVGLYSSGAVVQGGSRNLTTFDSLSENWVDLSSGNLASYTTSNTRVGLDSLVQTTAASATMTSVLGDSLIDLADYSGNDTFVFAFNVADANNNAVTFRFVNDASNYFSFALGAQTSGYKVVEAAKSTATATGVPDWSTITQIQIITTSKSAGSSTTNFDAIRIEDTDNTSLENVMISRQVLATPVTKVDGQGRTFEYKMDVTI